MLTIVLRYPGILRIGGNTGTVNSFTGVDTGDLTGGVLNTAQLIEGNNGACFFLQAASLGFPDFAGPITGLGVSLLDWATEQLAPINAGLSCPKLSVLGGDQFDKFPGASFKAEGQQEKPSFLGGLLGKK